MNSHIEQEHPEYTSRAHMWRRYRHLYAGGELFREHAAEYLVRRQKEPLEVYQERLTRVFYENYLGSIIDWYMATLVRKEPVIEFQGAGETALEFMGQFIQNSDLRGTTLTQFYREQLTETLVCGKSYVVVDFPKASEPAKTRAEEDASGRSRAYLVAYTADEVINWSIDDRGEMEWVVIRTSCLKQDSVRSFGWKRETRWIYYDREKYEIYEQRGDGARKAIELIDEGRHGFAGIGRVPIFELKVSEGLWLTNKVALLQLEHFNKSNALGWALTMGLFAMPVVYSDKEF
ncbi:MAG: phage portal protein, partial [Acidobacteriota bacterium]|nr:phage portal protein [Acidobacteriota bacterium]